MNSKNCYFFISAFTFLLLTGCTPKYSGGQTETKAPVQESYNSSTKIWKDSDSTITIKACPGKIYPLKYRLLDVDTGKVRKYLIFQGSKPGEISSDSVTIDIPLPDGSWEQFKIFQVQVMAPELAAKYPYLKTYAGSSIIYPADQIRLEVNPEGIRVMILSTRGSIIIDPFCKDDKIHMISYFRKNLPEGIKEDFEKK